MHKIICITITIILAFGILGLLLCMITVSSHASAAESQPNISSNAIQKTLIVNTLEDEQNNDGDCSLREAIEAANTNAAVDKCPAGDAVITDTITFSVSGMITLMDFLNVVDSGPLFIDGANSITLSGNGVVQILVNSFGADLTLNRLILKDGYHSINGGGIFNNGELVLNDCTLTNNTAPSGGGILNWFKMSVRNSTLLGNNADQSGGGIYNSGILEIAESNISANGSSAGGGGILNLGELKIISSDMRYNSSSIGGAIYNDGSLEILDSTLSNNNAAMGGCIENGESITITDSILSGNSASDGGGIDNGGTMTIINSILSNNSSTGIYNSGTMTINYSTLSGNKSTWNGGAIDSQGGKLFLINNSFVNNTADMDGGGISIGTSAMVTITQSTFSGNTSVNGGGIANGGVIKITNSTVSGNVVTAPYGTVSYGGGIYNYGTMNITNSTVSTNTAGTNGGGIYNVQFYGIATLNSNIVANNPIGGNCAGGPITDGGYNMEDTNTCGFDPANGSMPNTEPLLGLLQNNGGPTWTHALLPDSPAIDAGDDAQCPPTDQRGVPRPIDGDNNGVAVCDIGSFEREYQPIDPSLVTISGPSEGGLGQVTYFTATVEPISTTLPLTYVWQASDHPPITETQGLTDTVGWAWEVPGTQLITVTASNLWGSVSDSHVIIITDVPISELSASNDSPTLLGEATTFTATISGGTNVIFDWDFGDGFSGSGAIITHTYPSSGVYNAIVTATNSTNAQTDTTKVTIIPTSYQIYLPVVIKSSGSSLGASTAHSLQVGEGLVGLVIIGIVGRWKRREWHDILARTSYLVISSS